MSKDPATPRQAFMQGLLHVLPTTIGLIPFGLVTGVAGINSGLSAFEATLMSALVYSGTAQLMVLQLMGSTSLVLMTLAVIVVNLRYVMYSSASITLFSPLSKPLQALAAFLLVDQNFVMTVQRSKDLGASLVPWYYFGTSFPIWVNWIFLTYIGATIGQRLPKSWSLDFAVPLCFISLLAPSIRNRPSLVAATVGGLGATMLSFLPYNLGLFLGALAGIATGAWLEKRYV
jgi:predicted branched-subunit amino acid permease